MTGNQHYVIAENILQKLREELDTLEEDSLENNLYELARAQVHATLALASATGQQVLSGFGLDD